MNKNIKDLGKNIDLLLSYRNKWQSKILTLEQIQELHKTDNMLIASSAAATSVIAQKVVETIETSLWSAKKQMEKILKEIEQMEGDDQ